MLARPTRRDIRVLADVSVRTGRAGSTDRGRTIERRQPMQLEFGILAALLASFLTVPLPVPHIVGGAAWAALAGLHVARRRRLYTAVVRSRSRRALTTTVLVACAVVVTVTGVLQWTDVTAAIPWHTGSSTLLVLLAAAHAAPRLLRRRRRRPLPGTAEATSLHTSSVDRRGAPA
jgi:hypothetical protein